MINPNPSIQELIEDKAMSCAGYVNPIAAARETGYMVKDFYESRIQELEKENERLTRLVDRAVVCGIETAHIEDWQTRLAKITLFKTENNL